MLHPTGKEDSTVEVEFNVGTQPYNVEATRFMVCWNIGDDGHAGEPDGSVVVITVSDTKAAQLLQTFFCIIVSILLPFRSAVILTGASGLSCSAVYLCSREQVVVC